MNTGNKWLDGMHAHAATLDCVAAQASGLGRAFSRIGNADVADELIEISRELRTLAEQSRALTASKVHGDFQEATRGAENVVKACLAGAEIARR